MSFRTGECGLNHAGAGDNVATLLDANEVANKVMNFFNQTSVTLEIYLFCARSSCAAASDVKKVKVKTTFATRSQLFY